MPAAHLRLYLKTGMREFIAENAERLTVFQAANPERKLARLSCFFPRLEGCSPRIDVPELRGAGQDARRRRGG